MQAALQQIFYNLKFSNKAVLTSDLLVIKLEKKIFSIINNRNLLDGKAEMHGFNMMFKNLNVYYLIHLRKKQIHAINLKFQNYLELILFNK